MSKNKSQTEISISLDNDLFELLKNYAEENDTDISTLIQDLIEDNQNLYSPKKSFVTLKSAFTDALDKRLKAKGISKERYDMLKKRLQNDNTDNQK